MPPEPVDDTELTTRSVLSHLGTMGVVAVITGLLVGGLAIVPAIGTSLAADQVSKTVKEMPADADNGPLPQRSVMLAANGSVLATFYDSQQNRTNVELDQIAPIMQTAIISIEDDRFYSHGALDIRGTLRAFVTNQTSGEVQGGSSITQQLAKQTLVSQAQTAAERRAATAETYARKIAELRRAVALEENHSKDWILNRYLNIAYFGDGAYGIQSAAQHYFSIDAKDLNLQQSAMLAGLVKNPVGFDPTNNPEQALQRRNIVLARMHELGKIDDAQLASASKAKLGLKVTPNRNGCVSASAPFFCDYAVNYLLADPALGKTREDRQRLLQTGGLTIKTTLRPAFQDQTDKAVEDHVNPTDQAIGAMAMVEPGTGDVRAISQSRPMGRDMDKGETFLNYVIPSSLGDSAGFQAGSTFKVFVLAAALEQGISPYTAIRSPSPITLRQNDFRTCDGPYTSSDTYTVGNSTASPPSPTLYTGTQDSVNTFYVQLEQRTGICDPYKLAKKMGVQLTDPEREQVPSFTLGVPSVSPLEMAGAYATFAARGMHCDTKPVTEILNNEDKVFKKYDDECQRVISENTADTVNDILRGVMEGGFGSALQNGKPTAGKTGTIQDNKAVWFDGYSSDIATVAMVAGANSKGTPITLNYQNVGGVYAGRAFGSTVAGPLWGDAMKGISKYLDGKDFVRPTRTGTTFSGNSPTADVNGDDG
ncbi:hypothetical protein LUZ63_020402 [Rhynchospora breviuscula]|uniref:peptidoglycan glycosyltransferase n=1 Tax=Rhynchospora breviuscula TaxID=2022672 RepID=A0A9Q0C122_9POAL|nr:hypothetical protein LUZ63_020402 [Rhynchospora breviuscula]